MKKQYFAPVCNAVVLPAEALLTPSSNIDNTATDNMGGNAPARKLTTMYV